MAISIIVEDGTGLETATSYVSIAEYKAYWLNQGITISETDDEISIYLNLATIYLDSTIRWCGNVVSLDQALQVPRVNWFSTVGKDLSDSVPTFLKNALCELAYVRKANNFKTIENTGIKSEGYGGVSISYSGDSSDAKVIYTKAMMLLRKGMQCNGLRAIPT